MGAPTPVTRQTPVGIKLPDGMRSKIAFERDRDISLWEKSTKLAGIDNGEPIDTSTHHNTAYRTMAARVLQQITNGGMTCAYDFACYEQILAVAGRNGAITHYMIDGSTLTYWGYLKSADFADLVDGTFPEVTVEIVVTNTDPDDGSEAGPVISSVAGT